MRNIYVKYSNNRNRHYSTKTAIVADNGKRYVVKAPLFGEGKAHIADMYENAAILKQTYPQMEICHAEMDGDNIRFEFINGYSLAKEYERYINAGDKAGLLTLVDRHCELIKGSADNICTFEETDISRLYFGDLSHMAGKPGLKACNFDAIAQNIFVTRTGYCFIDYEWVFDVPLPMEFILYHCIVDIAYVTMKGLNTVISRDELLEYLGVDGSIGTAWDHFYKYITEDENGIAYEAVKANYEKNVFDLNGQLNTMRAECDKAKGDKFELELKALETMKLMDSLQQELADAKGAKYELELKSLEAMQQMEELRKETADAKGAKFELELKALETMQYVDSLKAKIEELKNQVSQLEKEANLKYQLKKCFGIKE